MLPRNFSIFPILQSDRLTLRQISEVDHVDLFNLRSNQEVNKYLNREAPKSLDDVIVFANKIKASIQENNSLYWIITQSGSNTFVGTICLFDFSSKENTCEIGFELSPSFQRQGIMKEATNMVIDYIFEHLKFSNIFAFTHFENMPSIELLKRVGFKASDKMNEEDPNLIIFTIGNKNLDPDNI
jgi:[ribosomal protein S5]-alanine N-acetyltransferase